MSIIIYPDIPRLLWIINHGSDSWGPHIPWIPLQSPSRFQSAHWVSAFGHERHGGFQQKSRRPGDGFKPIQTEGNWDQLVLEQYYTFGVDIHYKSGKKYLLAISLFFQVVSAQPSSAPLQHTPGAPNPSADFKLCTWGSTRVRLRTKETI